MKRMVFRAIAVVMVAVMGIGMGMPISAMASNVRRINIDGVYYESIEVRRKAVNLGVCDSILNTDWYAQFILFEGQRYSLGNFRGEVNAGIIETNMFRIASPAIVDGAMHLLRADAPVSVTPVVPATVPVVTPNAGASDSSDNVVAPEANVSSDILANVALPVVSSSIVIPNRKLTECELQAWIDEYWELGGPSEFELESLRLVNVERTSRGLNALIWCNYIGMSSRLYSQTMVHLGLPLGHSEGPYGGSRRTAELFDIPLRPGHSFVVIANNGGSNHATAEISVRRFMSSPGHRAAILHPDAIYFGTGRYAGRSSETGQMMSRNYMQFR